MNDQLPLTGIKVVEMSNTIAVPMAGRILAQYGADVIKIEAPTKDLNRQNSKPLNFPNEKNNVPLYDFANSCKKNICIDARTEEGNEVVFKLLENCDIFLTNTREKGLEKLGLSYDQIKDRFPKLIYAHFSGYGALGPEKDRPGFDRSAFFAKSGLLVDSAIEGEYPIRPPFGMGDIFSSSILLNGILMALQGRNLTGKGTFVESSLYGCGLWAAGASILNCQDKYGCKYPTPKYEPLEPFSENYKCKDGEWVCIMRKTYSKEKNHYAKIFNLPELLSDPKNETLDTMKESGNIPVITEKLAKAFLTKTSDEWIEIYKEIDVPIERGRHFQDNLNDPQAYANGYLEKIEYPDGETVAVMPPINFSEYGRRPYTNHSTFGEDTVNVLKEYGYSDEEISKLIEKKAAIANE